MPDLVAVAGNLHNARAAARWVRHADIALVSEAQKPRARHVLREARGRRYHTGPRGMGSNDAGRETGILLRDDLPDMGGGSYKVSAAFLPAPRVGKERWAQVAVTEARRIELVCISGHPVAAPIALRLGRVRTPLVRRHRAFTDWLDATLTYHAALGREAAVGLDANVRRTWRGAADLEAIVARHELRGIWDGLDFLMVTPGLSIVSSRVNRDFPSDHPLLRLDLNVKRNRRR